MALKDLLVYVDQTENSLVRLRLAADLAIRHDSRLTALYVREWNRAQLDARKAAELGLVSPQDCKTSTSASGLQSTPLRNGCVRCWTN
jgi:nucleotide-binding universal stress UspA family protein